MERMKYFYFIVAVVVAIEITGIHCDEFKIIETSDGAVRGVKQTTEYKNVDYHSFRGIPYAEAPIGDLRFKAPEPKKSWKPKVLDALEFGSICYQLGELLPSTYPQSEDCLFLNIYVPADLKSSEKLPVLFFIHGGGYAEGSGNDDLYGPDFLIDKQVILVTINYRLGIFGFMSLNLPEYSGNMGLKDQQLALKWVHKNIEYFNGDNRKIMVFGDSAGGASTHFHILSSESRKYFQNAAPMSGSAFDYWAMSEKNDHLDIANKIAKDFEKTFQNTKDLVKFLDAQSSGDLIKYSAVIPLLTDRIYYVPFAPVVERSDAKKPFMTKSLDELHDTQDIHINTMFTFTSVEWMLMILEPFQKMYDIEGLNSNFSIPLPFRSLTLSKDSKEYRAVNKKIREFYFGNDVIDKSKTAEYVNLISDINIIYGVNKAAKFHALTSKGETFLSRFDVDSKLNIMKRTKSQLQSPGAVHFDDLCYLFKFGVGKPLYDEVFSTQENDEESYTSIRMINEMTYLFTNFAKNMFCATNRNPNLKNQPIRFWDITNNGLKDSSNPKDKAMELWMDIECEMKPFIAVNEPEKRI